jgi:hypothetical protein
MDSIAASHGIMMLLLVPLRTVSGVLFPMAAAHGAVKAIMWANPVTSSVALLSNAPPGATDSLVATAPFVIVLLLTGGMPT